MKTVEPAKSVIPLAVVDPKWKALETPFQKASEEKKED